MDVEYNREVQTATFHSPLEEFEQTFVEVELREDPLTDRQARIVPESFLQPEGEPDVDEVVADDEGCFFCPGTVEEATPTYARDLGIGDRGHVGEATSFPNLNPYGAHSNVVALTEDHYVPIGEFDADVFADGLAAALEYVEAVFEADPGSQFASVNMNYLRPAGSSIVHPHLQTLVDGRGTNDQRALVDASRAYRESEGTSYWADLVTTERDGERWVGSTGEVDWLAPFAPKHHRHLLGVVEEPALPDPDGLVVDHLAEGVVNVLDHYADAGLNSFNLALYLAEADESVPPVASLVARSVFDRYYWSDSPFFTVLHDEGVVDVAPEEYAAEVREQF